VAEPEPCGCGNSFKFNGTTSGRASFGTAAKQRLLNLSARIEFFNGSPGSATAEQPRGARASERRLNYGRDRSCEREEQGNAETRSGIILIESAGSIGPWQIAGPSEGKLADRIGLAELRGRDTGKGR